MDYTITLTDTETKSLEYAALSNQDWIYNAAKNRARIAKEEIISLNTSHCNKNNIAIAVGEDAQVAQAYKLGIVQTAYQRQTEHSNSLKVKESNNDIKLKFL